jgi:catechol 2,3-dioxygenase-like lactoylglutathione lyase family enzyme
MSATGSRAGITRLSTIGIPVEDQDRSLAFYVDKLGFEKRMDVAYGQGERWLEVAPIGAATTIALMRARDDAQAGIDTQVRLTTDDARVEHANLQSLGVDADPEVMSYPVPMFSFRDPDGNRLVIVERPVAERWRSGRAPSVPPAVLPD